MLRSIFGGVTAFVLLASVAGRAPADATDVLRVQREPVFEFAEKPRVAIAGDRVAITFETAGFCDVTVAVEDAEGRIVRHLASGVLGDNAPSPFAKGSKRQTLAWDGKDDAGRYVRDRDACTVRVSLGLKPRFERTLFWHSGKSGGGVTAFAAGPEGMYVFQSGRAVDHLRLFDRDGNYLRTIYPFPSDKLDQVEGLIRHRFPDGVTLPIKPNWQQSSLLMSGTNCTKPTYQDGHYEGYGPRGTELPGAAASDIALAGNRLALVDRRVSRFTTDGTSDGLIVHGPDVSLHSDQPLWRVDARRTEDDLYQIRPRRTALDPSGEWLYLSRYNETYPGSFGIALWGHQVKRIPYGAGTDAEPEVFVGTEKPGKGNGEFDMPADVACDAAGRVYVADHHNDRVQIFSPQGAHLKNIPVRRPAQIDVERKDGSIYVFSWTLPLHGRTSFRGTDPSMPRDEAERFFQLTKFSAFDEAREIASWDLHPATRLTRTRASNVEIHAAIDTWADPPRVWISQPSAGDLRTPGGSGVMVLSLDERKQEWTLHRDLLDEAARSISRVHPASFNRQRLAVDPVTGAVHLIEGDTSHGKAFQRVLRIDPETGRCREVELPMSSEDLAFDREGHAYLRTSDMILRYRADDWREVPFDYGEERDKHHYGNGGGERSARVTSGAMFPGNRGFHQGGLYVSAKGHIVVGALYDSDREARNEDALALDRGEPYLPTLYPGRLWGSGQSRLGCIVIYILDQHGKMVHDDAVPGLHVNINGVAIDANDDVYLLNASPRVFDGKRHFNDHAGTLMKFSPKQGRLLVANGAPLPLENHPQREPDLHLPTAWVDGAHWMYPGVGWGGHNYGSGCSCPNARFALDYFARSFTPEVDRYNVGVLDSNGNLILRVGQYGNVDDGVPLVRDGGPQRTRAIGGDETSLFFAPYVATHSDERLFIADPGNARIVSVKLDYHTSERLNLRN